MGRDPPCDHVLSLIARHAGEIAARIEELERLRAELVALAERGRALDPAECGPDGICHVIEPAAGSPR
jgi:hypothetical protein